VLNVHTSYALRTKTTILCTHDQTFGQVVNNFIKLPFLHLPSRRGASISTETTFNILSLQIKFSYNSIGTALGSGWTIGVLGFDSRRRLEMFLFTTASRTAMRPTQPLIQWVPGALFLGVKRPGREGDRSPPSSAEVKECVEQYLHSPNTP
jgi:hypothetical protein